MSEKLRPQQKETIYAPPPQKQFRIVHIDAESGLAVYQHVLANADAKDYRQMLAVAKAYAKETICWINPEVDKNAVTARARLFPAIKSKKDFPNPDLTTERYGYIDVKSPWRKSIIISNANDACRQGAIAVITDLMLDAKKEEIVFEEVEKFSERIFSDRNVNRSGESNYTQQEVHWYIKETLLKCNRPEKK